MTVIEHSASSLELYLGCARRWVFERIEGFRESDTEQKSFGKDRHAELEEWLKSGKMPEHILSKKLLALYAKHPFPPMRSTDKAEEHFRMEILGVHWHGYTDRRRQGRHEKHRIVGDWKAQPNSEPVLLESGWTPMGEVRPGDRIYGSDGRLHRVISVHPQGSRPVWGVELRDGTIVRCDPEHLWALETTYNGKIATKTAREWSSLAGKIGKGGNYRLRLPKLSALERDAVDYAVGPYTIGAFLGDGGLTGGSSAFTSADPEMFELVKLPVGVEWSANRGAPSNGCVTRCAVQRNSETMCHCGRRAYARGLCTNHYSSGWQKDTLPDKKPRNKLTAEFRRLGMWGVLAPQKRVPVEYFKGSAEQRLALIQGLMDTDGCCQKKSASFGTSSSGLAADVQALVLSLGGTARICSASVKYKGEARTYYYVYIKMPPGLCPFRLARKRDRYNAQTRTGANLPHRPVVAIRDLGYEEESTCIVVSAPDSLYVTKGFALTHNTTKDLKYALVPDPKTGLLMEKDQTTGELKVKAQPVIYATREYVEGAEEVTLSWAYGQSKEPYATRLVETDVVRSACEDAYGGFHTKALEMNQLYQLRPRGNDVPYNKGYCRAFNKPCEQSDRCNRSRGMFSSDHLEGASVQDFLAAMKNTFPGTSAPANDSVPPPPPEDDVIEAPADSVPPPPPEDEELEAEKLVAEYMAAKRKPASAPTEVESGFVNPPEAKGKKPYATPEEAAIGEGVVPAPGQENVSLVDVSEGSGVQLDVAEVVEKPKSKAKKGRTKKAQAAAEVTLLSPEPGTVKDDIAAMSVVAPWDTYELTGEQMETCLDALAAADSKDDIAELAVGDDLVFCEEPARTLQDDMRAIVREELEKFFARLLARTALPVDR